LNQQGVWIKELWLKKWLNVLFGTEGEEHRIGLLAGGILVFITLVTGAMVFYIVAGQLGQELEKSIVRTLNDREKLFTSELEHRVESARDAAALPHLAHLMKQAAITGVDNTLRLEVQGIFVSQRLAGVALLDAQGQPLLSLGKFVVQPKIAAALRTPAGATLFWQEDYYLNIDAPIREEGRLLGTLRMEMPLKDLSAMVTDYHDLGESGEVVVCAVLGRESMQCFPSRHRPHGFQAPRMLNNRPLPLSIALDGQAGFLVARDYRSQEVFDAYKPIGHTGLGMVVKIDTDELERPIRRHLSTGAGVLVLFIILGAWLLRWQVRPLVHEMASSRKRVHAIMDNAADGLITIDEHGIIESFNISAARMFGYSPLEVAGKNVSMLMPEILRSKHAKGMQNYLRTGVARIIGRGAHEVQGQRKDGSIFPMDLMLGEITLNGKRLFIGSVRDTSEFKLAHDELKSSFAALKAANHDLEETHAQLRQAELDNDRQMSALAEANVRMVLYHSTMEQIRHADASFSGSGDADAFYHSILSDVMTLTGAKYGAAGLFDASGKLQQFLTEGIAEEERKKIGPYPVGKGLLQAFYKEKAITRVDRIAGDPRSCGFPPGHPPMNSLLGVPLLVNGVTKGVIYLTEKDSGEPFTEQDEMLVEMVVHEVEHILERSELMTSLRDSNQALTQERAEQKLLIVKLEEAQNQLLQSEKMASIGQLAAGVAHEINNPIGYVNSNLGSLDKYIQSLFDLVAAYEQAESAIADGEALSRVQAAKRGADLEFLREDVVALLSESREGITRVKKIVQDLKDFSHVDESEWQIADLHQGLESTLNIVWNEIKYKAEVVKVYVDLPEVECLPSQLNQVFMNLLVNAAHAIEVRGTITLRTGVEGEEVWVEIADTGKGIAPENLNRIFDPFFTTKPVGKGTGLGLSLSYSIVQRHHGRIEVTSVAGKGTTFRICLPVRQPEEPRA
jgi:PAS domain S-box-containing protein